MNTIPYNALSQTISKKIDLLRSMKNLSIRDLAELSGVSKSQLSNIIACRKIPNITTLENICNALEISLSDMFNPNEEVLMLRGKESVLIKIYRELSPMSQDTLIKVSKCMK